MIPPLYLVRHGETDWNAQGRLQGGRDVPLNALGRAQGEAAADRLAALVAEPAALDYVASPMARTRATMEALRGALGLDPGAYRLDPRLRELSFGAWEGLTWREVRGREPGRVRARDADRWAYCPPGEGAESYAALAARVAPALAELDRPALVVTHGGVVRAILVTLGLAASADAPRLDVWQGRVLVVDGAGLALGLSQAPTHVPAFTPFAAPRFLSVRGAC